jgi:DNA primase
MTLTPQWLDELRARTTLSAVISRTLRLTKAGHEFKACCPFHNEKSPSFTVNDQKGFYHCFGCGAHGDAIRWLTDQRGLAFMDAVKELAADAGMEVPAPDPRAAKAAEQQAGLHEAMHAAQDFYRAQLDAPAGSKAREYLKSRRFDAHTVERFGFGYAPAGKQALKAALKSFPELMLIEAGLRIAVDEKEPYDRFRDRLTIPIHDARGRVIGFAARILDAEKTDAPKYLNSPDTPLFDKGRTLFNLHRAGPAARRAGRIVVVEGQMDAIALAAAGIEEAVAPMGTALTERQLAMLWRLAETPILCFDGDAAGQRAAMRAATRALPLLRPAHSLRIVRLPAGMDPDDLIRRDGVAALEALLGQPISLLDLIWEHERDALPLATPEDKAGLKARLLAHVETIADRDIQALYRRELLERFSAFAFPRREAAPWQPAGRAAPARAGDPALLRRRSSPGWCCGPARSRPTPSGWPAPPRSIRASDCCSTPPMPRNRLNRSGSPPYWWPKAWSCPRRIGRAGLPIPSSTPRRSPASRSGRWRWRSRSSSRNRQSMRQLSPRPSGRTSTSSNACGCARRSSVSGCASWFRRSGLSDRNCAGRTGNADRIRAQARPISIIRAFHARNERRRK